MCEHCTMKAGDTINGEPIKLRQVSINDGRKMVNITLCQFCASDVSEDAVSVVTPAE